MANDRHLITASGDSLTVFRMNGRVCLARGRQEPPETIQMTLGQAYDLAGRLIDAADDEADIREGRVVQREGGE